VVDTTTTLVPRPRPRNMVMMMGEESVGERARREGSEGQRGAERQRGAARQQRSDEGRSERRVRDGALVGRCWCGSWTDGAPGRPARRTTTRSQFVLAHGCCLLPCYRAGWPRRPHRNLGSRLLCSLSLSLSRKTPETAANAKKIDKHKASSRATAARLSGSLSASARVLLSAFAAARRSLLSFFVSAFAAAAPSRHSLVQQAQTP